jgi:hypothetical protein
VAVRVPSGDARLGVKARGAQACGHEDALAQLVGEEVSGGAFDDLAQQHVARVAVLPAGIRLEPARELDGPIKLSLQLLVGGGARGGRETDGGHQPGDDQSRGDRRGHESPSAVTEIPSRTAGSRRF